MGVGCPPVKVPFKNPRSYSAETPALYSLNFEKKFTLQTDALEVGLGLVLSQEADGEDHPIVYITQLETHPLEESILSDRKSA